MAVEQLIIIIIIIIIMPDDSTLEFQNIKWISMDNVDYIK
jgi:hypothetical protein